MEINLTPEQQATIDKAHLDSIKKHSAKIGERIDESLRLRDEFAAENTYKFSDLLITIAIGIIGIASISGFRDLAPLSQIISTVFVLPIIVVILEISFKKKVIEVNREACVRRAKKLREIGLLAQGLLGKPVHTFDELSQITKTILETEDKGYKEIVDWVKAKESLLFRLRRWSLRLLIGSLVGMVTILLNQNGVFPLIIDWTWRLFIDMNPVLLRSIGLVLDIVGVVILALPVLNHLISSSDDAEFQPIPGSERITTLERLRYRKYGLIGLAFIVAGFLLQLIANYL